MPRVGFRFAGSRVWKLEFVIQTKPTRVDSGSIRTMKKIQKIDLGWFGFTVTRTREHP